MAGLEEVASGGRRSPHWQVRQSWLPHPAHSARLGPTGVGEGPKAWARSHLQIPDSGADNTPDPNDKSDLGPYETDEQRGWCSTWGAGHFSTFDHHMYDFSGTCNYVFAAICEDPSPTFSVQLRRGPDGRTTRIIVELGSSVVTVQNGAVSVKDVGVVSLPYTSNGLQITPFGQNVRLVAKQLELELEVLWGPDSYVMVLVEKKYMGQMCGLCGNFDGEAANEFLSKDGNLLEPYKYAALQKLDDPNEICAYEAIPQPSSPQEEHAQTCAQLLSLVSPECSVAREPFMQSCQADMKMCAQPGPGNCSCATLSEFSRQCSMAGQAVSNWRAPGLCSVGQCPANQVYKECGSACVRTCSNPGHSCQGFCTFGCFCPEGMVLDDFSKNQTCVPVTQCPCMLNGAVYAPGEVTSSACRTCQCTDGLWTCTDQPCPGRCSLEGGSFVTTFDARPYRFHGTCTYILLQSHQLPEEGSLMAVYDKSGYSHSETSLAAIIYLSGQDKIVISQDEVITNNGEVKWLPKRARNITIFRQTSTHLQMATDFGLELMIQLQPVFQAYITVEPQFRGQTRGLCGNFNGDTTDDFTTSMGIAEGTASLFVDSWRAGNCPTALERETDPCSMSQLNKVCAETHCSVLVNKGSVFEKCHSVVNPRPFYKRCVYQACNYEETFPHICAALSAYAYLCASRGVLLWDWRSSVDNCSVPCTGNRTFSYNSQACDRTCMSLSERTLECHPSAVPVDGCNCPEGTYLNHKEECVRRTQCPCQLDSHEIILAGQSTVVNGATCYCISGRLTCSRKPQMLLATCTAPKTFQSCSQSSDSNFGAACAPTCQMLATGIACVPTKCEAGCVCAEGLYEDASGQCVPADNCSCEFGGTSYPPGAELNTDCQTCICKQGKWVCEQSAGCASTCTLYGEGHVITFDGQRFVFDGNCEYTLTTDGCGANDSQPTFKIVTENVICGETGVTCSRAIKLFLGALSIVLADKTYTVGGYDPQVSFQVQPSSLHLVLDIYIADKYNLTLTWNKHMMVLIKVSRASAQDAFCGLCGNYNGNMKDDFETRSMYVASSELEFVNSWKENPLCGDVSFVVDPCSLNTFRQSWAERKCSIINSQTFAACHSKVYHMPYYEACVRDACGCDTGGDCECLCDAVAAYAKACLDKGVCVDWRTPDFCPVYCGFYNTHTRVDGSSEYEYVQEDDCTWHYQPCLCPDALQSYPQSNIEGCYNCSQDEYFDSSEGACVPCALTATTPPPTTGDCSHKGALSPQGLFPGSAGHPDKPKLQGPSLLSMQLLGLVEGRGAARTSTEAQPTTPATRTPSTSGLFSSARPSTSPTATPPVTPSLPATPTTSPQASSSARTDTAPTTQTKPAVSSAESPRSTTAVSPRVTSAPTPTSTWGITATRPTVTHATSQSTASRPSAATQTTAETTERTTAPTVTLETQEETSRTPPDDDPNADNRHNNGTTNDHTIDADYASHSVPAIRDLLGDSHLSASYHPDHRNDHLYPLQAIAHGNLSAYHSHTAHSLHAVTHQDHQPPPTATSLPTTVTRPTASIPSLTKNTTETRPPPSSIRTAKTTSPRVSHPPATAPHPSTSPAPTTITPKPTSSRTETPVAETTSTATPSRPHTPAVTPSQPTVSPSSSSRTTGPPSGTSFKTTTSFPTPSHPETTLPTRVPPFETSSVTPTSHRTTTRTPEPINSSPSRPPPTATSLPTTATRPTASIPSLTKTTTETRPPPSSISTAKTTPLSALLLHTLAFYFISSFLSCVSDKHFIVVFWYLLIFLFFLCAFGFHLLINIFYSHHAAHYQHHRSLHVQNHSECRTLVFRFLPVHISVHVSHHTHSHAWLTSFATSTPSPARMSVSPLHTECICSVKEYEEEITYLGCTANVTMTRCEGTCASSASFNIDTRQVDIQCGCCHPLESYEKQLVLPCPDPSAPGGQRVLTLLVFRSCVCSSQPCRD
ncbi:mucin-6 [Trichechus manatus latirostris]|uniref:Mucin-6 n=1 Tax=Trichechus manatus latirostris TaxID=127582 RepID=A0A2Y9QF64_TRIMA|nr:mucin-6 [Trichechus manatus latirostris]